MQTNKEFTAKTCNYFKDKPVLKAYLFGSTAGSESDLDSDLDIFG